MRKGRGWKSLTGRLTSFMLLAIGLSVLWAIVVGWVSTTAKSLFFGGNARAYENLMVIPNGQVVIQTRTGNYNAPVSFRDTDNRPIEVEDDQSLIHPSKLSAETDRAIKRRSPGWDQLIWAMKDPRTGSYWYLVHDNKDDNGVVQVVGYDPMSKRRIGYFGKNGFQPECPSDEDSFVADRDKFATRSTLVANANQTWGRLPDHFWSMKPREHIYFLDGEQVYDINVRDRTLNPIFPNEAVIAIATGSCLVKLPPIEKPNKSPDSEEENPAAKPKPDSTAAGPAVSITESPISTDDKSEYRLLVRMRDEVRALNMSNGDQFVYKLPKEIASRNLNLVPLGENQAVVICSLEEKGHVDHEIYRITAAGEITDREIVTLPGYRYRPLTASSAWMISSYVPSPVARFASQFFIEPAVVVKSHFADSYGEALSMLLRKGWLALLCTFLFALLAACWLFMSHKGLHREKPWLWAGLVFLFGPIGLVAYWLEFPKPVLETCKSCNASVPRDRSNCAACEDPFPQPALAGTEIFV